MENGDSAHSEHTHRNCNNTRYYLMHGTRTVVLLIPLNDGNKRNQKLQPPEHPHRQQLEGGAPYKLGRRVRTVHRHALRTACGLHPDSPLHHKVQAMHHPRHHQPVGTRDGKPDNGIHQPCGTSLGHRRQRTHRPHRQAAPL